MQFVYSIFLAIKHLKLKSLNEDAGMCPDSVTSKYVRQNVGLTFVR